MTNYLTALVKNFATDVNGWRKEYQVFNFVFVSVLQQGKNIVGDFTYTYTEGYLEPSRTLTMKHLVKPDNS